MSTEIVAYTNVPAICPLNVAASGATASTNFAWGSITKVWTAASIMQFVSTV